MALAAFTYTNPYASSENTALLEPPAPEIGEVIFGYSNATLGGQNQKSWLASIFSPVPRDVRNFFMGTHGICDVLSGKKANTKRVLLWDDIRWWNAIKSKVQGSETYVCFHSQFDRDLKKLTYVEPFSLRFQSDLSKDPESALFLDAYHRWLEFKTALFRAQLNAGQTVEFPIVTTGNANFIVSGFRRDSFVRFNNATLTVSLDGATQLEASTNDVTVQIVQEKTRSLPTNFCVLTAHGRSWQLPNHDLLGADILTKLIRGSGEHAQ